MPFRNLVAAGDSVLSVYAGGSKGDGRAEGQGHEPLNQAAECGLAAVVPVRWVRQYGSPTQTCFKEWLLHSSKREQLAAIIVGCWAACSEHRMCIVLLRRVGSWGILARVLEPQA